jgi:hypothetical protein
LVDSEDAFGTLEEDPQRVADLVQDNLYPNPSDPCSPASMASQVISRRYAKTSI